MATGTGKTYTAFQIIWRFWKSGVKKRILILVDRNILADQTKTNDFKPFGQAMTKITNRTVELESALLGLKRWIEQIGRPTIPNGAQAPQLVAPFFQQTKAAVVTVEAQIMSDQSWHNADVVLDFGLRRVLVETKFVRKGRSVRSVIETAVSRVAAIREGPNFQQSCVIVFVKQPELEIPDTVERHHGGEIISVAIRVA